MAAQVALRPFGAADIPELLGWISTEADMVLWSGTTFTWPLTADQLRPYADEPYTARRRICVATDLAGTDPAGTDPAGTDTAGTDQTGSMVGFAQLSFNVPYRSGHLGCVVVSPAARGRGAGSGLINAILDVAFDELKLHRVSLAVYSHNRSAVGLYERLGFVTEGTARDSTYVNDEFWPAYHMAILATERKRWGRH